MIPYKISFVGAGKLAGVSGIIYPLQIFLDGRKVDFSKAVEIGPENSQICPAVRNDMNTIEKQYNK